MRGSYDTAVIEAFKQVEVSVRFWGKFGDGDYGINLMRKAFANNGPLTDREAVVAEKEAAVQLFAGRPFRESAMISDAAGKSQLKNQIRISNSV